MGSLNRKGAEGLLETWKGTFGELVQDRAFQLAVVTLEFKLARGDHMPVWFNIQRTLELKQRDRVDTELGCVHARASDNGIDSRSRGSCGEGRIKN